MESPRKFNDCYFYYYSTCTKGDSCVFRHEPSALGCETMCTAWQQGKCLDKRCKLRHMELRKNRKQIPCYWENQPGGCRKMHCPFMHKNPDARTDGIAPSQPAPPLPMGMPCLPAGAVCEAPGAVPPPAPAPVPLLWQQQRQVVLDSALLGVLPGGELVGRRALGEPAAYPLPADPLVVNFEEESDNESAPSSTPTKQSPDDALRGARSKSQELLLLERIQAEAAAFYSYDTPAHYDRLSLDEIAGKAQPPPERRNSLDFKVLSLDEIRARKNRTETIVHTAPITINLNRKRKLSTHETMTTTGNKLLKVVRSNSIVYKKLDRNTPAVVTPTRVDQKHNYNDSRKRTISEQSDVYEMQEDELVDNCYEFKRIKIAEQISKPRLVRNRQSVSIVSCESKESVDLDCCSKTDNDSDSEVQIVSVEIKQHVDLDNIPDNEIIDVESTRIGETIDVVDLSEENEDSNDITISDLDIDLGKNVPDVVASCQRNTHKADTTDTSIICDIDAILNDDL